MKRRTALQLGAGAMGALTIGANSYAAQTKILPASAESLDEWRKMRFGMFIHWGPVSLTGKEIGWSRASETNETKTRWQEYDQLYKRFNPESFDADEWVSVAQDTGMKYVVLTSRHHDGFCLWDSAYTDYDIMSTPFRRDVLKELTDACKQKGVAFGPYFSICDWRNPDYGYSHHAQAGYTPEGGEPNFDRFVEYNQNQLREQIEKYGPYLVFWFDGEWEKPWTHERGVELNNFCRELQSSVLINNRVDTGRKGMEGMSINDGVQYAGDFGTPEQRVGLFNRDTPWETCMTIGKQWSWKPDDEIKSLKECLHTLIQTIGGDGNLLFNVGPMPDGRIEPRQVERLRKMGEWIKAHQDAIYETRGGPYMPGEWGAATCKGNKIYLFVMSETGATLKLPPLPQAPEMVKLLNGPILNHQQDGESLRIELGARKRDPIATVIELRVKGEAFKIEPIKV
ncbi:MAG: alpha-L-fucosidase [Candidatus Hinthialibacter antarcticus]|nr:alpha-L-fucosidase [Candidatus Hinthialibacter antarcticus]